MEPEHVRQQLIDWYATHQRRLPWRETTDPYAIWVSEVMLQQTQVATVIPYFHRFMDRFPGVRHLAQADLQEVLKRWEGLGYYSRARHLHRAAGLVVSCYNGKVPDNPEAFRSLPGVGDYIAAAVLSIAFGHVVPVIDGNVKRVLSRLLLIDTPVNQNNAHKLFLAPAKDLICPRRPADFNQAMMELGALVCRPKNPDCTICPLHDLCRANQHHTTAEYPKRIAARKIPHRHLAIGVILKKGKMLAVQRPENGFLGGLWEFPAIPADGQPMNKKAVEQGLAAKTGLTVTLDRRLIRVRHAYTHFTLTADVYLCQYLAGRVRLNSSHDHRWVTMRSLMRLPLHKAIHKFLEPLKARLVLDGFISM